MFVYTPYCKSIKKIVEPVFGDIKENKGITTFLTRGLKTVKTEFNLICIANNICRIQNKKQETFITLRNKHENENSETFSSQNKERNCMDINFSVEKSSLSKSIF